MQMMAVGQRHLVIGHVVQLVVHVADGVEMDAGGDERHHREHQHRERVDVIADRNACSAAEFAQRVPIAGRWIWRTACLGK